MLPNCYLVGGLEAFIHEVDLLGLGALLERRLLRGLVFGGLLVGVELLFLDELRLLEGGGTATLVQGDVEVVLEVGLVLVRIFVRFLREKF